MNIKNNLPKFFKGFVYAFNGIYDTVKTERNMRFHLGAGFFVLFFMRFFDLSRGEKTAVFISIAMVIGFEILNTAVESMVDMYCCDKKHPLAKKAKDAAAGAVLMAAVGAVTVGLTLFWDKAGIKKCFDYLCSYPIVSIIMIIIFIGWLVWVMSVDNNKNKGSNHEK